MNNTIILPHKKEKEELLSRVYVKRSKLEDSHKFLDSDIPKVITGPRRAGKSVFTLMLLKNKDFAYLNFDDENLLTLKDKNKIIEGIHAVYGKTKLLLFDEVQNLDNWEIFVNQLYRRGYHLLITGSNAKLLSHEMATHLTGRYLPIEILPFSFKEFLTAKSFSPSPEELDLPEVKGQLLQFLGQYLKGGGFPGVVVKGIEPRDYLDTLYDAILLKDVVKRYKVRFPQKIYDLGLYLVNNFSAEFSFTKLKNVLSFNSLHTLMNYLKYLEEAYLVFILNRFSFKIKEQIKSPKKVYLADNGFITAKSIQSSANLGKLMENLIFAELLKRGYEANKSLFYYKTRNQKEVDFVLKKGNQFEMLVQACYQAEDVVARDRGIKALLEAGEELGCGNFLIITWDKETEIELKGKKIKFVSLWRWLLA